MKMDLIKRMIFALGVMRGQQIKGVKYGKEENGN